MSEFAPAERLVLHQEDNATRLRAAKVIAGCAFDLAPGDERGMVEDLFLALGLAQRDQDGILRSAGEETEGGGTWYQGMKGANTT